MPGNQPTAPASPGAGRTLRGTGLSPGYGEGHAVHFGGVRRMPLPRFSIDRAEAEGQVRRVQEALEAARRELERVRLRVQADVGAAEAEIFGAHESMLDDGQWIERIAGRIRRDRVNAEQAVEAETAHAARRLAAIEDPYLRERALDVRDVGRRLLEGLAPRQSDAVAPLPPGSVLVAAELLPSETGDLDRAHVAAIVTELGGETSHAAILARALGIPAVTAVADATRVIPGGARLLVDGECGAVTIAPSREQARVFSTRQHPSVLRAIARVTEAARERGRPVSVCGEAAGDPATAALLVGLGVRELSMSPLRAAPVRFALRRLACRDAEALAREALACRGTEDVKRSLGAFEHAYLEPPTPDEGD